MLMQRVQRVALVAAILTVLAGGAWAADAKKPAAPARDPKNAAPATQDVKKPAAPATQPSLEQPIKSLRSAIGDLAETFSDRYPNGRSYLDRLTAIEKRAGDMPNPAVVEEFNKLQREALLANPLVKSSPILFVTRHQYTKDHHNTATFFPAAKHEFNTGRYTGGGTMKVLDAATGEVRTLVSLAEGVARDPDVHFDAKKILFSMRKSQGDSYHLYEINVDGTGLRQLTKMADIDDLDPIYLPDESIIFTSTREPKYCACNRHIMANLFRMDADGANIVQIGKSTLFEGHASLMPDGRILYDRWEYVDRNFGDAQGLWTVNPDGTNHAVYWKNNTPSPGAVVDGRIIPGTELAVCTFTSCHDRPWGAIAIIDRRIGSDGREPVVHIWPADAKQLIKNPGEANLAFDTFMKVKLKYEDPYPLADSQTNAGAGKYFLCAKMIGKGEQTGIYLIDTFGNEVLVHAEEQLGCFDPMSITPRPRPGKLPERRHWETKEGTFYVQDVYRGTHMAGVQRGSVKSLRIIEVPEKKFWTNPGWNGQGFEGPAMNWKDFNFKQILGTVPVEEDGSAYFTVPAETFVYFQLLDENGMMVQSMRSGTMVQPGERGSCVGCHDDRRSTPPSGYAVPMALRREPSKLQGWLGPARPFNYLREVQPVFDRQCVRCHDFEHREKAKVVLARDRLLAFNISYAELWSKKLVNVVGAGPAEIMQAYSWGSHPSKLVEILRKGHYDVKLSREELDRIITWVDINAPYYPSFASAFPQNKFGRAPLEDAKLAKLTELTGQKWDQANLAGINFDRPEESRCLSVFKDKTSLKYLAAITVIRMGQEALAASPGPDAEGFLACELDRWRETKYAQRQDLEKRMRQAIKSGQKAYDDDQSASNASPPQSGNRN